MPHRGSRGERFVDRLLERHGRTAAPGLVLGDQYLAAHVTEPVRERVGREAPEDDGVRRSDPRTREHRDRRLRNHAHVDADRRALADAQRLQRVRELRRLPLELRERDLAPVVGGLALPVVRDLVSLSVLDVAVDAVEADVELAAEVPPGVGRLPLVQLRERLEPGQPLAALGLPELVEVALVDVGLRVRLGCELRRRRIPPLLQLHRLDGRRTAAVRAHGSRSYGKSVRFSQPSSVTTARSSRRQPP